MFNIFFLSRLSYSIMSKRMSEYKNCRALGCNFQGKKQWHQQKNSVFRAPPWLVSIVISGYLGYYFLGCILQFTILILVYNQIYFGR